MLMIPYRSKDQAASLEQTVNQTFSLRMSYSVKPFILLYFWICQILGQQSSKTDCECVPFYLCSNDSINTNGEGIIDIRLKAEDCTNYLETCCPIGGVQSTTAEAPAKKVQCGYRNPEGVGYKIMGNNNNEAQFGEFPWMIAVFRKGKHDRKHFYRCGGSLIHPQVVLTGAHCVFGNGNHIKIRAGEWDSQTVQEIYRHEDREVESIVIHPEFKEKNLENDVALLFLKKPLNTTSHINTICLPRQDSIASGRECFVTGWGKDHFGEDSHHQQILKRIKLPVVPRDVCLRAFRKTRLGSAFHLHRSFMCAGAEGNDACTGDGGGPLVCPIEGEENRYQQVGIVAWGIGCATLGVPGAYADVAHFTNWIGQQLKQNNLKTSTYQT